MKIEDAAADIEVEGREELARGFRTYERLSFELRVEGAAPARMTREILRVGKVAAVLPYDPVRDEVVLLRQFRIGMHEATGKGDNIEIVAGLAEAGESIEDVARRETLEEIGIPALDLMPAFDFLPTPGVCDEHGFLFCGRVSSAALPAFAGAEGESELTRPFAISADEAVGLASRPSGLSNGYTRLALLWFALHRQEVRARWR